MKVTLTNDEEKTYYKRIVERDVFNLKKADIGSDVVLDLGAYIGLFSLYACDLYPSCTVFAYEPDSVNFNKLKDNVFQSGYLQRIKIYQSAIADSIKPFKFYSDPETNSFDSHSIYYNPKHTPREFSIVQGITMYSLVQDIPQKVEIGYLKVNIEGAETLVLKAIRGGMLPLSRIKNISIESHPGLISEEDHSEYLDNLQWLKSKFTGNHIEIRTSDFHCTKSDYEKFKQFDIGVIG